MKGLASVISRKAEVEWEPHASDINSPDFFLSGGSVFFKDIIYKVALAPLQLSHHWRRQEESGHAINKLSSNRAFN